MQTFSVDSHSNSNDCSTCCCQSTSVSPGETDKFSLFYAAWAQPIGGRGIGVPSIELVLHTSAAAVSGNQKPVVLPFFGLTAFNTPLAGALSTVASDPELAPLTYTLLTLYGPSFGQVVISPTGAFVYTPGTNYSGYDHFFYSVTDGVTPPVVGEVVIGVSPAFPLPALAPPTAANLTPRVLVRGKYVGVNCAWSIISIPVEVSPQAEVGSVWRMTVRTPATDCDGMTYYHVSCYDLHVSKC